MIAVLDQYFARSVEAALMMSRIVVMPKRADAVGWTPVLRVVGSSVSVVISTGIPCVRLSPSKSLSVFISGMSLVSYCPISSVTGPSHRGIYADVYCPNCGEKGHHIDYSSLDANGTAYCKAPKYEAFVKFPRCM